MAAARLHVGPVLASHVQAVFPWASDLTSLGLSVLFCVEWGY